MSIDKFQMLQVVKKERYNFLQEESFNEHGIGEMYMIQNWS